MNNLKKISIPPELDIVKIKQDLKFIADLVCIRVLPINSIGMIQFMLKQLVIENEGKQTEYLPLMLGILKSIGDDILGLYPEHRKNDMIQSDLVPRNTQEKLLDLVKAYHKWLVSLLKKKNQALLVQEKKNMRILNEVKGELSDKRKEVTAAMHADFAEWKDKIEQLSSLINLSVPSFDEVEKAEESNVGIELVTEHVKSRGDLGVWEDEDQKAFYTSMRSLKDILPSSLWQASSNIHRDTSKKKKKTSDGKKFKPSLAREGIESELFTYMDEFYEFDSDEDMDLEKDKNDEDGEITSFTSWISKLSDCFNRDLIDKHAEDFCTNLNTAVNRKKLISHLTNISKMRLDLIPFNCRMITTLAPLMPHVAEDVIAFVLSTFRFFMRKKEGISIRSKQKITRYIAELSKFGLIDRSVALGCLNVLIIDFKHHSIEMMCALLERCGRQLYLNEDSHRRLKLLLEKLNKFKQVKLPDYKYKSMIENALLATIPQKEEDVVVAEKPKRHAILLFAEHLILHELGNPDSDETESENCNRILGILKTFPFRRMTPEAEKLFVESLPKDEDEGAIPLPPMQEIRQYIMRLLSSGHMVRYSNLPYLANLVSGLNQYYECVGVEVADSVLEDIRRGMEIGNPQFNQRRISQVKYLAELYNYQIVNSKVIFKTVYSFITFGVIPFKTSLMHWVSKNTMVYEKAYNQYDKNHPPPEPPTDSDFESDDEEETFELAKMKYEDSFKKWLDKKEKTIASTTVGKTYANVTRALFGVQNIMANQQADKPDDLFRIRLVCSLLDTCGEYFKKGTAKKKLDLFLSYFQYYVIVKRTLPCWRAEMGGVEWPKHVDYQLSDTLQPLRPKLHIYKKFDQYAGLLTEIERIESELNREINPNSLGAIAEEVDENDDDLYEDESDDSDSDISDDEEIDEEEYARIEAAKTAEEEARKKAEDDAKKAEEERKKELARKQAIQDEEAFDKMFKDMMQNEIVENDRKVKDTNRPQLLQTANPSRYVNAEKSPSKFTFLIKNKNNKAQTAEIELSNNVEISSRIAEARCQQEQEKEELKKLTMAAQERMAEEEEKRYLSVKRLHYVFFLLLIW